MKSKADGKKLTKELWNTLSYREKLNEQYLYMQRPPRYSKFGLFRRKVFFAIKYFIKYVIFNHKIK